MLLRRRGEAVTVAATSAVARRIDDLERATGEGPCLDALDSTDAVIEPNLATPTLWPELAKRVLAQTPVRGTMGFRMLVDEQKVGALNLFSDTADTFGEAAARDAIVLASFASVAVTAIARGEEAATLRRGLGSNREIGKAIGLLMALHHCSDDEAFDILRRISQRMNRKIAELAREVIERGGAAIEGGQEP